MFSLCSLSIPTNHCRPHLAGHTGVSRRALLGQESGWGFTGWDSSASAPKPSCLWSGDLIQLGVSSGSRVLMESTAPQSCPCLQMTATQEALTSPGTALSPCHMPPLLTTWLFHTSKRVCLTSHCSSSVKASVSSSDPIQDHLALSNSNSNQINYLINSALITPAESLLPNDGTEQQVWDPYYVWTPLAHVIRLTGHAR